jgi:hypothetical protein
VLHDALAQSAPGPVEAHVKVRRGDGECGRGQLGGLAVDVDPSQDIRVAGGQGVEQVRAARAGSVRGVLRVGGDIDSGGLGRVLRSPRPMEVGDASPQDPTEPSTEALRVVEGPGALRGSHHRSLHDVLGIGVGGKPPPDLAHEPRAFTRQERDENAGVHRI